MRRKTPTATSKNPVSATPSPRSQATAAGGRGPAGGLVSRRTTEASSATAHVGSASSVVSGSSDAPADVVATRTLGKTRDPQLAAVHAMVEDLFTYVRQLLRTGHSVYDACHIRHRRQPRRPAWLSRDRR